MDKPKIIAVTGVTADKPKSKPQIISVTGATASGKSALAVEIAEKLNGEIVSCDSMQIYCGMDIGTAKPTREEMRGIPHHMIDVCDPTDNYSAADFADAASIKISEIASRGHVPIICGGTGMYLDSLLRPTSFSENSTTDEDMYKIRRSLLEFAEQNGAEALHARLREIDPYSAENIHPNNIKRVARAIEIYLTTGLTKTETDRMTREGSSPYDALIINLDYADRKMLYSRIDRRVDIMMNSGLYNEVKSLYAREKLIAGTTAAQAIGYKEILSCLRGEISVDAAAELIKKNSRNYAKRQITWFKRYDSLRLIPDKDGRVMSCEELCGSIEPNLERFIKE